MAFVLTICEFQIVARMFCVEPNCKNGIGIVLVLSALRAQIFIFGWFPSIAVSSVQSFFVRAKTIDTEGFDSRRCRIAAVLGRKDRKKSSQVKFPFFRCFYWRFSDFVLNFVDREGQKNIGVCVSAQRQSLLFQHLYLSYVLFHVLTLSPKDGRAAALYGKDPYGMSSESTALYIGITSSLEYFAEPLVLLLKTADFCRRHKERAPSKFFTC